MEGTASACAGHAEAFLHFVVESNLGMRCRSFYKRTGFHVFPKPGAVALALIRDQTMRFPDCVGPRFCTVGRRKQLPLRARGTIPALESFFRCEFLRRAALFLSKRRRQRFTSTGEESNEGANDVNDNTRAEQGRNGMNVLAAQFASAAGLTGWNRRIGLKTLRQSYFLPLFLCHEKSHCDLKSHAYRV